VLFAEHTPPHGKYLFVQAAGARMITQRPQGYGKVAH